MSKTVIAILFALVAVPSIALADDFQNSPSLRDPVQFTGPYPPEVKPVRLEPHMAPAAPRTPAFVYEAVRYPVNGYVNGKPYLPTHKSIDGHGYYGQGYLTGQGYVYGYRLVRTCQPLKGIPGCYPLGSHIRTLNDRTIVVDVHNHMVAILD